MKSIRNWYWYSSTYKRCVERHGESCLPNVSPAARKTRKRLRRNRKQSNFVFSSFYRNIHIFGFYKFTSYTVVYMTRRIFCFLLVRVIVRSSKTNVRQGTRTSHPAKWSASATDYHLFSLDPVCSVYERQPWLSSLLLMKFVLYQLYVGGCALPISQSKKRAPNWAKIITSSTALFRHLSTTAAENHARQPYRVDESLPPPCKNLGVRNM